MFLTKGDIINFFEKGIFLFKGIWNKRRNNRKNKRRNKKKEETEEFINNVISFIERKSKDINNDLFKNHFDFSTPAALTKKLFEIKDARENSKFVKEIKNRWNN